jgi:hypothetical protein
MCGKSDKYLEFSERYDDNACHPAASTGRNTSTTTQAEPPKRLHPQIVPPSILYSKLASANPASNAPTINFTLLKFPFWFSMSASFALLFRLYLIVGGGTAESTGFVSFLNLLLRVGTF